MRGMWRLVTAAMVLLLVLGIVPAQAQEGAPKERGERVRVVFWHAMSGRLGGVLNDLVEEFNKGQDRYLVEAIYQGNYDTLSQKLIASIYAGSNPACSMMYQGWATRFYTFGHLAPVQRFLDQDAAYRDALVADLFEAYRTECTEKEIGTGRPVLTTLPFGKSVYMLHINLSAMEAAGIKEPPRTWDELRATADALTVRKGEGERAEVTRYGFATRDDVEAFTNFLFMTGTNYMDENEAILYTGEAGEAAMAMLKTMAGGNDDRVSGYVESGYLSTPFGSERIAMFVGSSAGFSFVDTAAGNKFVWRAVEVPSRDAQTQARTLSQGPNIGIFQSNVTEQQQQGAWEFFRFLLSPEPMLKWTTATGYVPPLRSIVASEGMQAYMAKNPNFANAVGCLEHVMTEPKPIYWDAIRNIIARETQAVLSGMKTPEQSMQNANAATERVIAAESHLAAQ